MGSRRASTWRGAGCAVLGLEQFGIPHALWQSHGDTALIRMCYYEHAD